MNKKFTKEVPVHFNTKEELAIALYSGRVFLVDWGSDKGKLDVQGLTICINDNPISLTEVDLPTVELVEAKWEGLLLKDGPILCNVWDEGDKYKSQAVVSGTSKIYGFHTTGRAMWWDRAEPIPFTDIQNTNGYVQLINKEPSNEQDS